MDGKTATRPSFDRRRALGTNVFRAGWLRLSHVCRRRARDAGSCFLTDLGKQHGVTMQFIPKNKKVAPARIEIIRECRFRLLRSPATSLSPCVGRHAI